MIDDLCSQYLGRKWGDLRMLLYSAEKVQELKMRYRDDEDTIPETCCLIGLI